MLTFLHPVLCTNWIYLDCTFCKPTWVETSSQNSLSMVQVHFQEILQQFSWWDGSSINLLPKLIGYTTNQTQPKLIIFNPYIKGLVAKGHWLEPCSYVHYSSSLHASSQLCQVRNTYSLCRFTERRPSLNFHILVLIDLHCKRYWELWLLTVCIMDSCHSQTFREQPRCCIYHIFPGACTYQYKVPLTASSLMKNNTIDHIRCQEKVLLGQQMGWHDSNWFLAFSYIYF